MENILPSDPDLVQVGIKDFDIRSRRHNPSGLPITFLPFDLPPVVIPQVKRDLEELLSHPEDLPLYDLGRNQRFIPGEIQISSLYDLRIHSPKTTLEVQRDPATGKLLKFKEGISQNSGRTASNSTSFLRKPCNPKEALLGSGANLPFWPAGMEQPTLNCMLPPQPRLPWDSGPLLSKPPEFKQDYHFTNSSNRTLKKSDLSSILQVLRTEHWLSRPPEDSIHNENDTNKESQTKTDHLLPETETLLSEVNILLNRKLNLPPILKISEVPNEPQKKVYEWAIQISLTKPLSNFKELVPDMAIKWEFELDAFQKHAVLHLERHDSVFVAAHTSAGKTVVAEYAIQLALNHNTRVIYTSPVKALSNQKYRDFKIKFGDVGLLTGDIQINEKAACLIMTTEILRSMLYRGAETIKELEWVIFDEVHYINDPERGVVWEEVLIMLPSTVKLVMLSATVSNVLDLADWVGRTKKTKIYVISTYKRPIPLEHYLYTGSVGKMQDEKFLIVDSVGGFLEANYRKACQAKEERTKPHQKNFGPKGTKHFVSAPQDRNIYQGVLNHLKKQEKLPVICFTLSRKRCNQNAELLSSLDLVTEAEKGEIHNFFWNSIATLKQIDRKLPQIKSMAGYLKHGFGIHHSGILPILKEIVEMLFQKSLIKVLFATETFAIGVNMPARSVIFDSTRKHDGQGFRDLISSEYIQMAGRAGRRGLDPIGTVIILCKGEVPDSSCLKQMMLGKPPMMESRFRITYSMVLNLLRARQIQMEEILRRSFRESFAERSKGERQGQLQTMITKLSVLTSVECDICSSEDGLAKYCETLQTHQKYTFSLTEKLFSSKTGSKLLSFGRIVFININEYRNIPGAILAINFSKRIIYLLILMKIGKQSNLENADLWQKSPWVKGPKLVPIKKDVFTIEEVPLESITCITSIVISISKKKAQKMRQEIVSEQAAALYPELSFWVTEKANELKWCTFENLDTHQEMQKILACEDHLNTSPCLRCPQFLEHFQTRFKQFEMQKSIESAKLQLSDTSLQLLPNYQGCLKVLEILKYIDSQQILTMKGRVACEMSSYELLLTELLSEGVLSDCTPAECAALLSCFVFQQKCEESPEMSKVLVKAKAEILMIGKKIERIQEQTCLCQDPDYQVVDQLRFGLTHVVHQWAKGVPFAEIAELTETDEGIIVRTIQRLVEVMKDIRNAAHIFGNDSLKQKVEEASQAIKRDIVFAGSLYTK